MPSKWQLIPVDVLLTIMEYASFEEFTSSTTKPPTLRRLFEHPPKFWIVGPTLTGGTTGGAYMFAVGGDVDEGLVSFPLVCRYWHDVANSGAFRARVAQYSVIPLDESWGADNTTEDLLEVASHIRKMSTTSQVELSLSYFCGASRFLNPFLEAVAPFLRRLTLDEETTIWDDEVFGHELQPPYKPGDIQFPKLRELRVRCTSQYPLPAGHQVQNSHFPNLVRLRVETEKSLEDFAALRPTKLHLIDVWPKTADSLLTGMAGRLSEVKISIRTLKDACPKGLFFPMAEKFSLTASMSLPSLIHAVDCIVAPRLVSLRVRLDEAGIGRSEYDLSHAMKKFPSLKKFPRLQRLTLGGLCVCIMLWLARSDFTPNLQHLWLEDERQADCEHRQEYHWIAINTTGRTCLAREAHITSNGFRSVTELQLMIWKLKWPLLKSLLLQTDRGLETMAFDRWFDVSKHAPQLSRLILKNLALDSLVYTGRSDGLDLMSRSLDLHSPSKVLNPKAKTMMFDVPCGLPICEIVGEASQADTLIFACRRKHSPLKRLYEYLDLIFLSPVPPTNGAADMDISLKSRVFSRVKGAVMYGLRARNGDTGNFEGYNSESGQLRFPLLHTLVISLARNVSEDPFVPEELVGKLREIVDLRHRHGLPISRIVCTKGLRRHTDRSWFADRNAEWESMRFGGEAINRIFYRHTLPPRRSSLDLNLFGDLNVRREELYHDPNR